MKKILILISFIVSLSFVFGCDADNSESQGSPSGNTGSSGITSPGTNTDAVGQLKIEDYFPIRQNIKYTYEGKGNEFAAYTVFNDYTSDNRVQQRINNGGTEMVRVMDISDGKLSLFYSREEAHYRENLLKAAGSQEEILLMEPLEKGTTWTLEDSRKATITGVDVDITVPAGSYKAIEVTTEGDDGKTVDYYVKDVGLVKSVFNPGENEISSSLAQIEENALLTQTVNFYYPSLEDDIIYYQAKDVSFKTNDITKMTLEKAYKEIANEKFGSAFTTNTKINSLYLNNDKMVYIDLTGAFLTELNAGAMYEKMILQSIANTFGNYYNAGRVILTVDNKLYESGHIAMKKGEFIQVSTEKTEEVK